MRRVVIIGQPGSGKSTLARALGERTFLPVFHMDCVHWLPGWQERAVVEKVQMVQEIVARDAWIFEGNNSATSELRLARADTLIWLDLPLSTRLFRVILRTLRFWGRTRPDLPEGCPERFDRAFFAYIWRTRQSGRDKLRDTYQSAPQHVSCMSLRSGAEVRRFLDSLDTARRWGNLGISHR